MSIKRLVTGLSTLLLGVLYIQIAIGTLNGLRSSPDQRWLDLGLGIALGFGMIGVAEFAMKAPSVAILLFFGLLFVLFTFSFLTKCDSILVASVGTVIAAPPASMLLYGRLKHD